MSHLSLSPNSATPVSVIMQGVGLCGSDSFSQIPGSPTLFLGRRMVSSTPGSCAGNWTVSLFSFNYSTNVMTWVQDMFMTPFQLATGGGTVTNAYDPTVMAYNGELWVSFECVGTGSAFAEVDACVAPFTIAGGVDLTRLTVPVAGSVTSTDLYSASTPKIVVFQGQPYLYWTVVDQSATNGAWQGLTTRGMALTQEAGGARRFWATGFAGASVPSVDPSNVEVMGIDPSNPLSNGEADVFQVFQVGELLYVTAGVGGAGCLNPTSPIFGCYRVQVSASSSPLAYHAFQQHEVPLGSGLPFNPEEYARFFVDPNGNYFMMGQFLPANLEGQTAPDPVLNPAYSYFYLDPRSLNFQAGASVTGLPAGHYVQIPAAGLNLTAGESLAVGTAQLIMQGDGNLVLYDANWNALWNSQTGGGCGALLTFAPDSTLTLSQNGSALWQSPGGQNCGAYLCQAIFQIDGNIVIFVNNVPVWNTGTNGISNGRPFYYQIFGAAPFVTEWFLVANKVWTNVSFTMNMATSAQVRQVGFVNDVYGGLLGRQPDAVGLQDWTAYAQSSGATCAGLAEGILSSPEFEARAANSSSNAFVTALYQGLLSRNPSSAEVADWATPLSQGTLSQANVEQGFLNSTEFHNDCNWNYGF